MSKPENNYFKVNRQLLHSDRWFAEKFTRAQAWVDLFGLAQHSDNFFLVRGIKVETKRGQLAYSQLSLASRWSWSRDKVRRFLKCLENEGDIIQQNNEVTTIITITKYEYWQGNQGKTIQQTIQQKNNRKTTNDTHTKNDKDDKDVKKESKEDSLFETLWNRYPRRDGKKEALKHYCASVVSDNDIRDIGIALENYIIYLKRNKTESKFVKMGSTWFNNWRDWVKWVDPLEDNKNEAEQKKQSEIDEAVTHYRESMAKNGN